MKTMILAAIAALSLSAGVAYAQGYAGAVPQVYGSQAFARSSQTETVSSTPADHAQRSQSNAPRTVERNVRSAKGG